MNTMMKTFFTALVLLATASIAQADVLLKDMQGRDISFASLKGKWVLINYWAGWCKTCVEEIPEFNRFYHKYTQDKVALFAVNYDALPVHKQNRLIKKLGIQYPSLLSDPSFALGLGDITGVPMTFVFNPEGQLVTTLAGGQNLSMLEEAINKK